MTLKEVILSENSKLAWEKAAVRVLTSSKDLKELMAFFNGTDIILVQRATQIIGKVYDKDKAVLAPYLVKMILGLSEPRIDAYKRNVLRIFQTADIPEKYEGHLFDKAFGFLEDKDEPVAIKAFAMTVCRRIAQRHQALAPEIADAIELILQENESAGIESRGRKELKLLRAIERSLN